CKRPAPRSRDRDRRTNRSAETSASLRRATAHTTGRQSGIDDRPARARPGEAAPDLRRALGLGSNSISLPKPRESTAKSANPRGGAATTKRLDFQVFLTTTENFDHNSGR